MRLPSTLQNHKETRDGVAAQPPLRAVSNASVRCDLNPVDFRGLVEVVVVVTNEVVGSGHDSAEVAGVLHSPLQCAAPAHELCQAVAAESGMAVCRCLRCSAMRGHHTTGAVSNGAIVECGP